MDLVVRGQKALDPVRALRPIFGRWLLGQQKTPVGGDERAWPDYPALVSAQRQAALQLRSIAGALAAYTRSGRVHESGDGWVTLSTETVHEGAFLALHRDQVIQPDGRFGTYDHVTIADGARVVAVDSAGRIAIVTDSCHLPGRMPLLPGGGIAPGEAPEGAACRECEEETGWRPRELHLLAVTHPIAGLTMATIHLYRATDLESGRTRRDPTEVDMTVEWIPWRWHQARGRRCDLRRRVRSWDSPRHAGPHTLIRRGCTHHAQPGGRPSGGRNCTAGGPAQDGGCSSELCAVVGGAASLRYPADASTSTAMPATPARTTRHRAHHVAPLFGCRAQSTATGLHTSSRKPLGFHHFHSLVPSRLIGKIQGARSSARTRCDNRRRRFGMTTTFHQKDRLAQP